MQNVSRYTKCTHWQDHPYVRATPTRILKLNSFYCKERPLPPFPKPSALFSSAIIAFYLFFPYILKKIFKNTFFKKIFYIHFNSPSSYLSVSPPPPLHFHFSSSPEFNLIFNICFLLVHVFILYIYMYI